MTYLASFRICGDRTYYVPITDTNKKRIIQKIRKIAEGNRPKNSECTWVVWIEFNAPYHAVKYIARGGTFSNGVRYRIDPPY